MIGMNRFIHFEAKMNLCAVYRSNIGHTDRQIKPRRSPNDLLEWR